MRAPASALGWHHSALALARRQWPNRRLHWAWLTGGQRHTVGLECSAGRLWRQLSARAHDRTSSGGRQADRAAAPLVQLSRIALPALLKPQADPRPATGIY